MRYALQQIYPLQLHAVNIVQLRNLYTGWPKKLAPFFYALISSNINRFSKLFHCQNQEKVCNNTITKDPTTSQVCCYTTLWNLKYRKSNKWYRTTSV